MNRPGIRGGSDHRRGDEHVAAEQETLPLSSFGWRQRVKRDIALDKRDLDECDGQRPKDERTQLESTCGPRPIPSTALMTASSRRTGGCLQMCSTGATVPLQPL